jgi:hypothetical protein
MACPGCSGKGLARSHRVRYGYRQKRRLDAAATEPKIGILVCNPLRTRMV